MLFLRLMLLGLLLVGSACGGASSEVGDATGGDQMSPNELGRARAMFYLVNDFRRSHDLAPLTWHVKASEVAYHHALASRRDQTLEHVGANGQDPSGRLVEAGILAAGWGENLARGSDYAQAVFEGWLASASHRANLLQPAFTHLGTGVSGTGDDTYWAQDFLAIP